ncbi:Rad52/Rad22 family DNA repair protein [Micromonospora sp. NPDC049230]|uniref:Rad52/Rad22 family DNA repair protein n=1 Tax=Micromonospora sp. NPDC049230 TaxID=3155502 RepID=UPI0034109E46
MTALTTAQYDFLIQGLGRNRVSQKQGQSHVEAWDIRRHLIRVFGFGGFDIETIRCDLVKEIETKQGDRSRWTIVYRAEVRLTIKATDGTVLARYEDGATGDGINMPSVGDAHDFAMKTALSQALKRCAVNLGDQFGLALYNGGNPEPVVHGSLVRPPAPAGGDASAELPHDDAPVLPEPGTESAAVDEHQEPQQTRPVSAPPAPEPKPVPTATGVRDWTLRSDRTAEGIRQAAGRLLNEHPAVAATQVTNEHGDQEQLSVLMARRAKELDPRPQAAAPTEHEERRRKRMFALLTELGYGEPAKYREVIGRVLKRDITSSKDISAAEVEDVIAALAARQVQLRNQAKAEAAR